MFHAGENGETPFMVALAGVRVLADARRLIQRGWCWDAEARTADGDAVEPWDERAASWSILGALVAVLETEGRKSRELPIANLSAALYALADVIEVDSLAVWNDAPGRSQAEVVSVLESAERVFAAGAAC